MSEYLPPVVARLIAKVDDFIRDFDRAADRAERDIERIERAGQQLDTQFDETTGSIGGNLDELGADFDQASGRITGNLDEALTRVERFEEEFDGSLGRISGRLDESGSVFHRRFDEMASEVEQAEQRSSRSLRKLRDAVDNTEENTRSRTSLMSRAWSMVSGTFTSLTSKILPSVASKLDAVADKMPDLFSSGIKSAASFAGTLAMIIPLVSVIGGLVMYAGGAIVAGLGGLPVLLSAIIGPIAAIIIGIGGIGKAADSLNAPMKRLKTAVENAFEKTFTPIFRDLAKVFPALESGLVSLVRPLGNLTRSLVGVVTTRYGLENLSNAFDGMGRFLDTMSIGATRLFEVFIKIAGTQQYWDILGSTFNVLLNRFGRFLNQIHETGALEQGLRNLQDILYGIANLLSQLGVAALDFFNGATPGLQEFLNGLTDLTSRINWTKLGEAFGSVFGKLGEWLKSIPTVTLDRLVDVFVDVADAINGLIDSGVLNVLVALFGGAVKVFAMVIEAVTWVINKFGELGNFFSNLPSKILGALSGLPAGLFKVATDAMGGGGLLGGLTGAIPNILGAVGGLPGKILSSLGGLPGQLFGLASGALGGGGGLFGGILSQFPKLFGASTEAGTYVKRGVEWLPGAMHGSGSAALGNSGFAGGMASQIGRVAAVASGVQGAVRGGVAGLSLFGEGAAITESLIAGMRSRFQALKQKAAEIAAIIKANKGPIEKDRVLLVPEGRAILDGLMAGMQSRLGALERLSSSIGPDISARVGTPQLAAVSGAAAAMRPQQAGLRPVVNLTVQGSLIHQNQLKDYIQTMFLRNDLRNTQNGLSTRTT